jgi:hypothetical protein
MPSLITDPQVPIRAAEATGNIPSDRRVRDVADRIAYLDPDSAPLTLVLSRARSMAATNTKFEWIEKDLPARWAAINNGGGYNTTATSLVVDTGTAAYFSIGDVVKNVRTGEVMRVTAVNTGTHTLTVVRAVDGDGTTGTAINDNDDLLIIGNAYAEGVTSESEKSHPEAYKYNYTQIVRTPFGVTGSEAASENYTGPDRPRLRAEKAIEHKIDLERTALFGERNLFTATDTGASANTPRRYTGGYFYYVTSLATNINGILTEPDLETYCQTLFSATGSGDTRLLLCSPLVISVLDQLAASRIQVAPRESTFGLAVKTWVTGHGTLNIVKHRLLENGANGNGYGGHAIGVDPSRMSYRYLRGRNTKLMVDIQANDLDGHKDEYLTEMGWQVELDKVHGYFYGVTG